MRFEVQLVSFVALALVVGCRSQREPARAPDPQEKFDATDLGTVVEPASEEERQLLGELPSLAAGTPKTLGALQVVADAPYAAASGRECRRLRFGAPGAGKKGTSSAGTTRLACSDGQRWFFVPDVFGPGEATASP